MEKLWYYGKICGTMEKATVLRVPYTCNFLAIDSIMYKIELLKIRKDVKGLVLSTEGLLY